MCGRDKENRDGFRFLAVQNSDCYLLKAAGEYLSVYDFRSDD